MKLLMVTMHSSVHLVRIGQSCCLLYGLTFNLQGPAFKLSSNHACVSTCAVLNLLFLSAWQSSHSENEV